MTKRMLDLITAFIGIIVLSPLLLLLIYIVRLKLGSPVFFKQKRPGLNGNPFVMVKFRTMTEDKDSDGNLLADSERITPFGVFLRSTSFDEIPELWNVLKGEMSLVGPRPLYPKYNSYMTEPEKKRFEVKPGITGLAQVEGRNIATWRQRLVADRYYVKNQSTCLDIYIIIRTIKTLLQSNKNVQLNNLEDFDVERSKNDKK